MQLIPKLLIELEKSITTNIQEYDKIRRIIRKLKNHAVETLINHDTKILLKEHRKKAK